MRRYMTLALLGTLLTACGGREGTPLAGLGRHEVTHVEEGEMLKLRAGPGTGYVQILGLPNGTTVHVNSCQPNGNTSWCNVTLGGTAGVTGFVSKAYLEKL